MLDRSEIADLSALVASIYGDLEEVIIRLIVRRLIEGAPDLPASANQWKVEKLLQSASLNRQIQKQIIKTTEQIPSQMVRVMYTAVSATSEEVRKAYLDQKRKEGLLSEPDLPLAVGSTRAVYMIEKLQEQALDMTNLVNTSMLNSAQQQYIDILNRAATQMVSQEVSPHIAIKTATRELTNKGLTGYTDRSGRRWGCQEGAEMILRAAATNAQNQAAFSEMDNLNVDLILVSSHMGARPLCSLDQGRIFSRSGGSGTVKDGKGETVHYSSWNSSTYGQAAGILGINCRHHIMPFFPGYSTNTQKRPNKAENDRQYKLSQEQRKRERKMRYLKRKRDVAIEFGDKQEVKSWRSKIWHESHEFKQWREKHGLTRQKVRERNLVPIIK